MTVWFSDLPERHAPTSHCLVCRGYGGLIVTHGTAS